MNQEAKIKIRVKTDASAAMGISIRTGLGKLRHMSTTQLWVQEKVRKGDVEIVKVPTWENIADTLTKYVNKESIGKHMRGAGSHYEEGRHDLMPELDAASELGEGWFDEGAKEGEEEGEGEEDEERNIWWIS